MRIVAIVFGSIAALGAEVADDMAIIIYPDRQAPHRKTIGLAGMLLPDWFIGDNMREFVLITSPAQPGPAHTRDASSRGRCTSTSTSVPTSATEISGTG